MLMGTFGVPLGVSSLDLAQPNVGGGGCGWMDGWIAPTLSLGSGRCCRFVLSDNLCSLSCLREWDDLGILWRSRLVSSRLISIIFKAVDRVVQSEETDGSETSAISIFRLTTTLSISG